MRGTIKLSVPLRLGLYLYVTDSKGIKMIHVYSILPWPLYVVVTSTSSSQQLVDFLHKSHCGESIGQTPSPIQIDFSHTDKAYKLREESRKAKVG